MLMLAQLTGLIVKEVRLLWSDRRSRIALIIPPLLQLFIFAYAATYDVDHVPIAVLNEDTGPYGRELVARFNGSPTFEITALPTSERQIKPLIDEARVMMALHIGPRFSADLRAGRGPSVQVILDGRRLPTALTVQSYVTLILAGFNADYSAANGLARPAATTVARAWFNPILSSHWFIIPGLIGKLVLIVTLTATVSIAREREVASFDRMFVLGLTPLQILAAKSVLPITVGFFHGVTMSLIAAFWFGVPFRGSLAALLLSLLVFVIATTGIGLMLSSRARSQRQATLRIFMFLVPAVMLSGFATPIAAMPEALQLISLLDPLRYFDTIIRALCIRGSGWSFVWGELWPLGLLAVAAMACAWLLIRPQGLGMRRSRMTVRSSPSSSRHTFAWNR
jgi:ABC-2 type transport system permease protein